MSTNEINQSVEAKKGRCGDRRCWKFPFIVAGILLIKSVIVMLLWNALIPDLFHGPVLTYLQAFGITVLAKLLVGHGHGPFGRHHGHHGLHKAWKSLSFEEREKLRAELRKRHGE